MRNLVLLRNTLEKTDEDAAAAKARAIRVAAELKTAASSPPPTKTTRIARREHINKLMADIKSLEEGVKRLQGGALDKAPAGDRVKSFRGRGERASTSVRCSIKGKRILVLLDTSASMMDDDVVKVSELRNQPEAARRARAEVAARARHGGMGQRAVARQQPVPGLSASTRRPRRCWRARRASGWHQRSARHQQRADRGTRTSRRRWHQPRECIPVGAHHAIRSPTRSS